MVVRPALSDYRRLWLGFSVSTIGDGVTLTAGPLLVASLTHDPLLVAGALFAQQLPWLLFSLVSGVYVDRLDRRRLIAFVDLGRAVIVGGLALSIALGGASIDALYVTLFLLGTGETLARTATLALLPSMVGPDRLGRANAQMQGSQVIGSDLSAPPFGAFLFVSAAALPFAFDSVTFVVAGLLGLSLRTPRRPQRTATDPQTSVRADVAEGLHFLWQQPVLRSLALCICLMNVTFDGVWATFVLYARDRLGLGPEGYGLLLAIVAVGSLLGAATVGRLTARLGTSTVLRAGMAIEACTHLVLALTRTPWVAGLTLAVFGVHAAVWSIVTVTLRQRLVPDDLLGRVTSAYALFSAGGAAVGALLGGILAHDFGLTAPFWFAFAVVGTLALASSRIFAAQAVSVAGDRPK
ncbi:MFS transporter [Acidothermaceae bacterium B102]|nr:MFS transporter [Acidothermaceae bacterium B102]